MVIEKQNAGSVYELRDTQINRVVYEMYFARIYKVLNFRFQLFFYLGSLGSMPIGQKV